MDPILLLLRLVHVLLGVFWAGTIFFFAAFLLPSLGDIGPDAGKVMGALQKRNYVNVMPVIALITIISGILLFYKVSGGFSAAYPRSHYMGYGTGGTAAIIALAIGMILIRPAANRMGQIMQSMPSTPPGPEKDALLTEVQKLRQRTALGSQIVAGLLLLAVILMAVTRYV